jgi:hypothetical protein
MEIVMPSGKIHKRGLTSFFTLFGFLIMSITGLVLYLAPAGRVAYWTTWEFIGITKTDWDNIHILSSILFIVAGAFHIFFNWKPLINYFRDRLKKGVRLRRELLISTVISTWLVVSAVWLLPPLSYLLHFNEWLKTTWVVQDDYEPPFGHAELLSLQTFAKKMDIDLGKATQELKANGIVFRSTDETLEEIGRTNDMAPMNIYLLIKKFEPAPEPEKLDAYTSESIEVEFSGTGIGNRSISSICERLGLDTTTAIGRLGAVGLETSLDRTLKSVADDYNSEAIEVMKVLLIEGYKPKTERPL